jgi:catechol 2,3-dioxygenase
VQVQALGHVVLKVRDLHRSEGFYSCVLGMRIISRISDPRMTFFTLGTPGTHHDFALIELGPHAPSLEHDATGLAHVVFKVGSSAEALRLARSVLHASGTLVLYEAERAFTKSVHVLDPDGNEIELYIDTSDAWNTDRERLRSQS